MHLQAVKWVAAALSLVVAGGCSGDPAILEVRLGIEEPVRSDIVTVRFSVEVDGEEVRRSERPAGDYSVGFTRLYVVYAEETPVAATLILEGVTEAGEVSVSQRRETTLDFFGSTRSIELILRCSCVGNDNVSGAVMGCNSEECGSCAVPPDDLANASTEGGFSDYSSGSILHCGGCGQRCTGLQNVGGIACMQQRCAYLECDSSYANCDTDETNGCEASLNSAEHCGACDAPVLAGEVCSDGVPVPTGECQGGEIECAGACVDTGTSLEHCGGCDRACVATNASSAQCGEGGAGCSYTCIPGFGDCNGDIHGCELELREVEACNSCDRNCDTLPRVTMSFCRPVPGSAVSGRYCWASACAEGWGDCDRDLPDDMGVVEAAIEGCETQLNTTSNCGECGATCSAGQVCCDGACCNEASCTAGLCPSSMRTGTSSGG